MAINDTCACSAQDEAAVRAALESFEHTRTNLIPILHEIQDRTGRITGWAMEQVAEALKMPLAEVWGTATFYTMFDIEGAAKHIVRVCDSPPCHITGSAAVLKAVQEELGIKPGEVTPDGMFGLEEVACLGLCGVAPVMLIDREVFGNLTPEMVPGIIAKFREEG
jgi:NADH:ubiquinone oxidoreductase subunit E